MGVVPRFLVAVLVGLSCAGCGPLYQTRYTFESPDTAEGRLCASQCVMWQQTCLLTCQQETTRCQERERDDARRDYRAYVRERESKGLKIKRTESSFYNAGHCANSACADQCAAVHRQCHETCGGTVSTTQACVAFCDQAPPVPPALPATAAPKPPPKAPDAPPSTCQPGRHAEVLWEGNWYPARILGQGTGARGCRIHYEGYESKDDETVPLGRIRYPG
ncbi:MBT domain-containing protein [Pararhodospirillum oryzae]|uniref:Agenet-like domain-containing protein n=1 Tax=Pararhodospirillum oryzae TaxID=478448 RepID=A0A512H608_9PROT|nr:hypothetical protein [Pararhodospirillum oryzae]GEO80906.1 hypothetical protein ROR02_10370 [Pararhodospirillum oryzae]